MSEMGDIQRTPSDAPMVSAETEVMHSDDGVVAGELRNDIHINEQSSSYVERNSSRSDLSSVADTESWGEENELIMLESDHNRELNHSKVRCDLPTRSEGPGETTLDNVKKFPNPALIMGSETRTRIEKPLPSPASRGVVYARAISPSSEQCAGDISSSYHGNRNNKTRGQTENRRPCCGNVSCICGSPGEIPGVAEASRDTVLFSACVSFNLHPLDTAGYHIVRETGHSTEQVGNYCPGVSVSTFTIPDSCPLSRAPPAHIAARDSPRFTVGYSVGRESPRRPSISSLVNHPDCRKTCHSKKSRFRKFQECQISEKSHDFHHMNFTGRNVLRASLNARLRNVLSPGVSRLAQEARTRRTQLRLQEVNRQWEALESPLWSLKVSEKVTFSKTATLRVVLEENVGRLHRMLEFFRTFHCFGAKSEGKDQNLPLMRDYRLKLS